MTTDGLQELLSRHAPILRFDARELFYPTAVEPYIATSALVVGGTELLPPGEVTPEHLDHRIGAQSYLRFISDHDRRSVVREEARRLAGKLLGPRLGRVGYFGRILDALFLLSVFLRPTTPRLTTVAAALKADRHSFHQRRTCYGRVVQVGDWLVLHYAYFYVMNDWRSSYQGVNDHEADWEQAWIFCDPADRRPVWVVCSSHDYLGSDLRRHWDDPECVRIAERPVLFAGGGSHALFFRPGDYISRIEIPGLRWLLAVQKWFQRTLRIHDTEDDSGLGPALGVPFVDSAPGDGTEIADWDIRPLDEGQPWFGDFRGLWGLDTNDPLNGERGPAGPKFNRGGDIRLAWADPVGFAGLHGTSPPSMADPQASLAGIEAGLAHLDDEIRQSSRLMALTSRAQGDAETVAESRRLSRLLRQRTELRDLRRRVTSDDVEGRGLREHLRNPAVPIAPSRGNRWMLAIWATLSVPLALVALAAPFLLNETSVVVPLLVLVASFAVLEQLARGRISAALRLTGLFVAIALLSGFVGVITVSRYAFGAALAAAALLLFVGNLRELRSFRRRRVLDAEPSSAEPNSV
ncbi:MAG: hypothetical protein AAF467_14280 [Actinomycetota bacterium]